MPSIQQAASQLTWRDYVQLWQLSQKRIRSEADYRTFQAFQASLLIRYLLQHQVDIQDKLILDLGSGIGGYSEEMARRGAQLISLDLMAYAVALSGDCLAVAGSALALPLQTASIDFVFCASLIEHVPQPAQLLAEVKRVLKPGGFCYLSFPPFYSPVGGHEYAPFHYFGEHWALRLATRRRQQSHPLWAQQLYKVASNPISFAGTYQDWGLFVMTIAKARQLIAASDFELINMATRYLPVSFIRWPLLGELLTWHAQFLLKKPA